MNSQWLRAVEESLLLNLDDNTRWLVFQYIGKFEGKSVCSLISGVRLIIALVPLQNGDFVSCSERGSVFLCNQSGAATFTFRIAEPPHTMTALPNARQIAVNSGDTIDIWDVYTGTLIKSFGRIKLIECDVLSLLARRVNVLLSVGNQLVSSNANGCMSFWNIETGECNRTIRAHSTAISVLATNGSVLLSADDNGTIAIWDIDSKKLKRSKSLRGSCGRITSVVFLTDESIASASVDMTISIWNIQTKKCITMLSGHAADGIIHLAALNNGLLASGSCDGVVHIWDIDEQKEVYEITLGCSVYGMLYRNNMLVVNYGSEIDFFS